MLHIISISHLILLYCSSYLFIYNLADIHINSIKEFVYIFYDLSGEIKLTVYLQCIIHVTEWNIKCTTAFLISKKCLVHI